MRKQYLCGQTAKDLEQLSGKDLVALARNISGLNQGEFGTEIGKSQSVVSKYERGAVEPPGEIISHCMTIIFKYHGSQPLSLGQIVSKLQLIDTLPMAPYLYQAVAALIDAFSLGAKSPATRP